MKKTMKDCVMRLMKKLKRKIVTLLPRLWFRRGEQQGYRPKMSMIAKWTTKTMMAGVMRVVLAAAR